MKLSESELLRPGSRRTLRFYMTGLSPCPYLDNKRERKAFTSLMVPDADSVHNLLSQAGFRRSQGIAYRPACPNCNACRSVRIDVRNFHSSKRWRRVLKKNTHLTVTPVEPEPTREQYGLLMRYLRRRHEGGGMSEMSFRDYAGMVADNPIQSVLFEYRTRHETGASLVAVSICDVLSDGLSMVYSFFAPEAERDGLGNYMILDNVQRADTLGLPHVYLGYWIKGSRKMDYKRQFAPLQVLDGDAWRPFTSIDI